MTNQTFTAQEFTTVAIAADMVWRDEHMTLTPEVAQQLPAMLRYAAEMRARLDGLEKIRDGIRHFSVDGAEYDAEGNPCDEYWPVRQYAQFVADDLDSMLDAAPVVPAETVS